MANDEHSDEDQRDSDPDSTLKRPLPIFYTEIKDENSRPTAPNVRLSTHTYIHKCVHRQTHLSCKCRIITVLSVRGKPGCLLKIGILKRFIDVTLGNGGETLNTELVSLTLFSLLHKIDISCIAREDGDYLRLQLRWERSRVSMPRSCDHQNSVKMPSDWYFVHI